ncbi:MAG: aquaporin family protein, partial [Planctomycetales bacterium]|nr:aquaporin family protein [Planctomycetales bacterium]
MLHAYLGEFFGALLLILLGNGVVANVILPQTKGHGAGWVAITLGWGMAVFVAVWCVKDASGAHINPAVTLGLAIAGEFPWDQSPGYIAAQMAGAFAGAVLAWLTYRDHFQLCHDPDTIRGAFCNSPAVRNYPLNVFSEAIATSVLV